jgi:hypothetical protein
LLQVNVRMKSQDSDDSTGTSAREAAEVLENLKEEVLRQLKVRFCLLVSLPWQAAVCRAIDTPAKLLASCTWCAHLM